MTLLPTIKGNNSYMRHNFRMKDRNVQMVFALYFSHMHNYYKIKFTNKKSCTYSLKGVNRMDLTMIKTG